MSFHPSGYWTYLQSHWWKNVRKPEYWRTHKRQCEACWRRKRPRRWLVIPPVFIVVHHKSYDHLGAEPDEDLVALCSRPCHRNVHAIEASGRFRTLREATDWYIAQQNERRRRRA